MTRDKALIQPAQLAVNFSTLHQDQNSGGWAPKPGRPPTTLVTAWQVLALKSAHMAYLPVPPDALKKAIAFLDQVQIDGGAAYGRSAGLPRSQPDGTSNAAGLLCRMYLGWRKNHPALVRGVQALSEAGPSKTDAMYNLFATQVIRHLDRDWAPWNRAMRDQLIQSQSKNGDQAGSWSNPAASPGRRTWPPGTDRTEPPDSGSLLPPPAHLSKAKYGGRLPSVSAR